MYRKQGSRDGSKERPWKQAQYSTKRHTALPYTAKGLGMALGCFYDGESFLGLNSLIYEPIFDFFLQNA
jgi:hypothetical protein